MITAIVFSRDRACQLDALLTSLEANGSDLLHPIFVLWTASDTRYLDGYRRCRAIHERDGLQFVKEANFRQDLLCLLEGRPHVCFFTDDDILYRPLDETPEYLDHPDVVGFSLRLGINTWRCYPLDREQRLPVEVWDLSSGDDGSLRRMMWEWPAADADFGYPFSLDGHVLRTEDILELTHGRDFTNPNQLEDVLAHGAQQLAQRRPLLVSYEHSVVVGVPVNSVNETHVNRYASWRAYPQISLNDAFITGQRIRLDELDFTAVTAAHQELELVLR